jgi:hypothetical protein
MIKKHQLIYIVFSLLRINSLYIIKTHNYLYITMNRQQLIY